MYLREDERWLSNGNVEKEGTKNIFERRSFHKKWDMHLISRKGVKTDFVDISPWGKHSLLLSLRSGVLAVHVSHFRMGQGWI